MSSALAMANIPSEDVDVQSQIQNLDSLDSAPTLAGWGSRLGGPAVAPCSPPPGLPLLHSLWAAPWTLAPGGGASSGVGSPSGKAMVQPQGHADSRVGEGAHGPVGTCSALRASPRGRVWSQRARTAGPGRGEASEASLSGPHTGRPAPASP